MNTEKKPLRIGVVGLGPIGATLTAHFIEAGAYVVVCDIDRPRVDQILKDGLVIENKIQKTATVDQGCYAIDELSTHDLDLVVVAVKASSLGIVTSMLASALPPKAFIMCAQNGLDNEQEVADLVGADRTLRMVVNFAGGMASPTKVNLIFFNAPNYIAALAEAGAKMATTLAELLTAAGLATEVPDNIRQYTWEKAILNAALAPVCAITRLTMKEVMDSEWGLSLVKTILHESIAAAEADGFEFRDGFGEYCVNYLKQGGPHRPSMAVDLDNGLPTEIDYMNGKIADFGEKYGLPTPVNRTISALVHMLEPGE